MSAERNEQSDPSQSQVFETSGTYASSEQPRAIGGYSVEGLLGAGGMAVVYDVRAASGERFAIKWMRRELANDARLRARFAAEGALAMRVSHPARVAVHGEGEHEGSPYLVLERVDGESVEHIRRRLGGRMPLAAASRIALVTLEFLEAAHRAGVLHRDIKPTNVLLAHGEGDRAVRIVDFGIAQAFGAAQANGEQDDTRELTLGTPSFLAPEAVSAPGSLDGRADVFATGALFFSLVTGKRLHRGRDHDESLFLAATQAAPPIRTLAPELSAELAAIVDRALAYDRESRWPTAGAMHEALMPHVAAMLSQGSPRSGTVLRSDRAPRMSFASGMPMEAPTVRGTLAQTPLVQLLQHLFARRLSGVLLIGEGDMTVEIDFARGIPVSPRAVAVLEQAAGRDGEPFCFELDDETPPSGPQTARAAMLAVARKTPRRGRFEAMMREALARLGERPIRLRQGVSIEELAPTFDERIALETARDLELGLEALIDAEVAPREVVERLVYALGVSGALAL
jgi:serine/threonine protein kinase